MERRLPSVDRILRDPGLGDLVNHDGLGPVTDLVRNVLADLRAAGQAPPLTAVVEEIHSRAVAFFQPSLRGVVNATGVIIHTNLGRAPLSEEAIAAMEDVSRGYSNLEFDLGEGGRGSRAVHVEEALVAVTGAEAGLVVNNNASALLLVLSALCRGHEVVISRGQAVEIGGGFRIPDVMAQSGSRLIEVGTTNRTYLADYEGAVGEETAALIRVHSSNFRVVGFTSSVSLEDMSELARPRGLLLLDDLGSGCLIDSSQYGLAREPLVQESIASGADLVMFSGDKLLGGPQAGIVVGRRKLISALRKHPLARALRMDKASTAALEATLRHYRKGEALNKVPVWQMIAMPVAEIERRANRWQRTIGHPAQLVAGRSVVGGGSLPEESLPTTLLAVPESEGLEPKAAAARLRALPRPIVARIAQRQLLLDPRTVHPRDDRYVANQLRELSSEWTSS